MLKPATTPFILALLAGLAALLVAWFAPLPRLVLRAEEKAGERMPQNRAAVESARAEFEQAQSAYKSYISTHDIGTALATLEASAQSSSAPQVMNRATLPVTGYLKQLGN